MKRQILRAAMALALLLGTSGCLYPNEMRKENQMTPQESLTVVKNAVESYRNATGVLPIRNKPADTPLYEKYPVDFKLLTERGFLGTIPGIAYENGGRGVFVLVDPEEDLKVRLIDVLAYQTVQYVQARVTEYNASRRQLPLGEPLEGAEGFYSINYKQLGISEEKLMSAYSGHSLQLILHQSGRVGIDYGPDLALHLRKSGKTPPPDKNLLDLLVEETPYAPAASFPYRLVSGEPRPYME
ncbi:hypothetical protein ACFQWB_10985 [Paenibacillus thermoaerophilus]|uniref:Uncharacterized protein n=1 Tax=Paenibacillus thermoaerophilus TaxID=1215385 RepID=A0ABW2V819_9BACL|nr:hypothetical protein [Paenibacillus thermoaerophilus]TMV18717.1 hypothetical protein FE781_01910 [Paenibacillus thermoaerophilus]